MKKSTLVSLVVGTLLAAALLLFALYRSVLVINEMRNTSSASASSQATMIARANSLSRGDMYIARDNTGSVAVMVVDNLNNNRLRVAIEGPTTTGTWYEYVSDIADGLRSGKLEIIDYGTPRWHAVMDSIWAPASKSQ